MRKLELYNKHSRVICPVCGGTKKATFYNKAEDETIWDDCDGCGGEGIVFKIIQYKKLSDAK